MESGRPVRYNFVTAARSSARRPQWKRIHDGLSTVICVFCLVNLLLDRVCRGFYRPASLPVSKCQCSGETRQSVCELKCWVTEGNYCLSTPNSDVWRPILHFTLHKCGTGLFSRVSACCHFKLSLGVWISSGQPFSTVFLVIFWYVFSSCDFYLFFFPPEIKSTVWEYTTIQSLGSVRVFNVF